MIFYHDIGRRDVGLVLVGKLGISQGHGPGEIFGIDSLCHLLCLGHGLHQRFPDNLVLVDGDEARLCLGGCLEDGVDSLNTLKSSKHSVIGYSGTTPLNMSKSGDARVKSEATLVLVSQKVLDLLRCDLGALLVPSTLCNNDNSLPLP